MHYKTLNSITALILLPILVSSVEIAFIHPIEWNYQDWTFQDLIHGECVTVPNPKEGPISSIRLRITYTELNNTPKAIAFYDGDCDEAHVRFVLVYYQDYVSDQAFSLSDLPEAQMRQFTSYKTISEGTEDYRILFGNAKLEPGDVIFKEGKWRDWRVIDDKVKAGPRPDSRILNPIPWELYRTKRRRPITPTFSENSRGGSGLDYRRWSRLTNPLVLKSAFTEHSMASGSQNPLIPTRQRSSNVQTLGKETPEVDKTLLKRGTTDILEQVDEDETDFKPEQIADPQGPMRIPGTARGFFGQEGSSPGMRASSPRVHLNVPFSRFKKETNSPGRSQRSSKLTDLIPPSIRSKGERSRNREKLLKPPLPFGLQDDLQQLRPNRNPSAAVSVIDDEEEVLAGEEASDAVPDEMSQNEKISGTTFRLADLLRNPQRQDSYKPLLRGLLTENEDQSVPPPTINLNELKSNRGEVSKSPNAASVRSGRAYGQIFETSENRDQNSDRLNKGVYQSSDRYSSAREPRKQN